MHLPYSELKKGVFLVASPQIENGIFFRSVVLLCDHSSVGSFGLIVNKPLQVDQDNDLLELGDLAEANIQIRAGGPKDTHQMTLLQNVQTGTPGSSKVCEGIYLNGDMDSLSMTSGSENSTPTLLCLGYGVWNTGVLEREFLNSAWFLHPATPQHVFETPVENLWQTLLREMGGKYKTFSMIPEDLELN